MHALQALHIRTVCLVLRNNHLTRDHIKGFQFCQWAQVGIYFHARHPYTCVGVAEDNYVGITNCFRGTNCDPLKAMGYGDPCYPLVCR